MRITVAHNKSRQEAMRIIDETAGEFMKGVAGSPVQITDHRKNWNGSTMEFGFTGRMGPFSAPISGTVFVTDVDVTIDIELPAFLKKFLPEEKMRSEVEGRVRGLLT